MVGCIPGRGEWGGVAGIEEICSRNDDVWGSKGEVRLPCPGESVLQGLQRRDSLDGVAGIKEEDILMGLGECSVAGSWCQGDRRGGYWGESRGLKRFNLTIRGSKRRGLPYVSRGVGRGSNRRGLPKERFARCVAGSLKRRGLSKERFTQCVTNVSRGVGVVVIKEEDILMGLGECSGALSRCQ